MSAEYELYTVQDALLDQIEDQCITDEIRANGILLTRASASWFLANGMIAPAGVSTPTIPNPGPVRPIKLDKLFAPTLSRTDDGKSFIFRAISGQLVLVEYVHPVLPDPTDPGGPTGPSEPSDIGDMVQFFMMQLK